MTETGRALVRLMRRAENALLSCLLASMILMAVYRIVQRNLMGGSPAWSDELLRALVLWLGLFGAMAAARESNHIHIDVLTRYIPGRAGLAAKALSALFTSAVSGFAAWYGYAFVATEMEFGAKVMDVVPAWAVQSVIPAAFGVIALRYLGHFFTAAGSLAKGEGAP